CTDSAPMHLAVAVKTYMMAMFGPTEPKLLLPPSDRFMGIRSLSGKMSDIDPTTVLEKIWAGQPA
ncbi:MAG: lipopolysaccharide heptosyltransferase family protein, partial [Leptolyngbyaceae cyanobacterium CAN_BIN12]|nr:lipopolysaccharide heptosyltransferase family protein [Leptolyngbyaceae cyanobacterium CAN_BIN12]